MNITVTGRRGGRFAVIAGGFFALFLVFAWATPLKAQFAGGGGTTGITLAVADWVPARDKDYGGWGVVAAGGSIETPLQWTKDAPSLKLGPGSYDVYWVQDYDTRDKPILLAKGVTVEADKLTTVNVDSGVRIEIAAWVPVRDKDYGWWGAASVGSTTADEPVKTGQMVNWTKSADALLLPPGDYDVYWVQDYDTRDTPILLTGRVKVEAGTPATVTADSGVRIEIAAWVPPRDKDYGWWGAAVAGGPPDKRVNWTKSADALLLPPGNYDVYWVQDYDTRDTPIQLASAVSVGAGKVETVGAKSGMRLDVADWVPARDKDYGWWGAVKAGDPADKRVNWSKGADALLLPAGVYDVYWVQTYATRQKPLLLAAKQNVQDGEYGGVGIEIVLSDGAIKVVTPVGGGPADRAGIKAGDVIAAVDGESVEGRTLAEAVGRLRGAVGASAKLTIRRDNAEQHVSIEREAVSAANVARVNTGIKPVVAAGVPPLDKDYGWWGAAPAWQGPDKRVAWSEGQAADPLVLPPGRYDIYWRTDSSSDPQLKAREVEVMAGSLVDVPIGVESIVVMPTVVVAFNVRSTDGSGFVDGALPEGVNEIEARYEWNEANIGRRLGVRWFKDDQMVLEQGEPVATTSGETKWALKMQDGSALPKGNYRVELMEDGELRVPVEFAIGTAAASPSDDAKSAPEVSAGEDTAAAVPDAGVGQATSPPGAGTGGEWVLVQVVTAQSEPDISDDFSDPKSGWTVIKSATRHVGYADDAYHISLESRGPGEGWVIGSTGELIGDAILQVDVTDAADSIGHPLGVVVRAQDLQNFHAFIIANDESYAVFHVEDNQFGMDGEPNKKLPEGVYRRDGPNRIQVFLVGDRIVYFLNERQIDQATAIWPTGSAGVLSANPQAGKSDVAFDDWKVWTMKPDEGAASAGAK